MRYAGSVAGVVWAYIQPALTVAAYFLVFDLVFNLRGARARSLPESVFIWS